jgi:hypothetical protein
VYVWRCRIELRLGRDVAACRRAYRSADCTGLIGGTVRPQEAGGLLLGSLHAGTDLERGLVGRLEGLHQAVQARRDLRIHLGLKGLGTLALPVSTAERVLLVAQVLERLAGESGVPGERDGNLGQLLIVRANLGGWHRDLHRVQC